MSLSLVRHLPRLDSPWSRFQQPTAADCAIADRIARSQGALHDLSGEQIHSRAATLRDLVAQREVALTDQWLLEQCFALVDEVVRRNLGLEYYPVQFLAACGLVRGAIVQMATGEGKTLVQALAAFVFALQGNGVHVMTSNAYLAERDFRQLAAVFGQLGMSVGVLDDRLSIADKEAIYQADITYGSGYQFGFDFLHDQVTLRQQRQPALGESLRRAIRGETSQPTRLMQRGHAVAIVDEADSVMIDEATMPLLLSSGQGAVGKAVPTYAYADQIAATLTAGREFLFDAARASVRLTRKGLESILRPRIMEKVTALERPWPVYVEQALIANHALTRNVDYIVEDGKVILVDQQTGRLHDDRTLSRGLHQAVEAKEKLEITATRRTLARVSRQQFLRLYRTVSGMTGTAQGSEPELKQMYGLRVVVIPTHKRCQRTVLPARFFASKSVKYMAVVDDLLRRNALGQPVLVGTRTIEASRQLADLLGQQQISFELLDGTQTRAEADVVASAGQLGAVTIATNIAGRGTDIRLGPGIPEIGGLHVIATEPHDSRRVDWQLFGRAARQGDPGSCQMFVSADDELLRIHGQRLCRMMQRLADDDGEVRVDLRDKLAAVQSRVERAGIEQRRQLFSRDEWIADIVDKLTSRGDSKAS